MTDKISVGPPVLTINRGSTFMVTDHGGEIDPDSDQGQGVFADDTRFVSTYRLRVDGASWQRVSAATVNYHTARIYLINPVLHSFDGPPTIEAGTLGLRLSRSVDAGIQERFEITNYSQQTVSFVLELELASDFADLFEVRGPPIREREHLVTHWDERRQRLTTSYHHQDYHRCFVYRVTEASSAPSYANGRLRFSVKLEPAAVWSARGHLLLQPAPLGAGAPGRRANGRTKGRTTGAQAGQLQQRWLAVCTRLETPNEDLRQVYRQAVDDMGALRLFERDLGPDLWVPAAGVPWYVALFGRDSLIASLQNMPVHARFAEGALRTLAEYQAKERDDWRDAQPGKIVHEIRHGELAHFNLVPHAHYYGTWDATPLYLIVLHAAWRWLGDRALVEQLLPTAEGCLSWIDHFGDLDGDGFQEYQTYSAKGYENMGWKDAQDAVVYPDGRPVAQPKATCELQGYVYAAKLGLAELYQALGQTASAERLRQQAAELKQRFNQTFWMEQEGTYAFGLDKDKRQIQTVASNAGHCLWSGIADQDKAERVARRLLAPDMWSGWGIRTLSSKHPAYNPFSYQRGSVWPHDNSLIAAGMSRYGLHAEANQVAQGILAAAAHFQSYRLPEVFAGLAREPASFPVQYRGANVPQAWAAGSVFQLVGMMLGLRADAPGGRLEVAPALPDWVPSIELRGLQVGSTNLDLRVWRQDAVSRFRATIKSGPHLEVVGPGGAPVDASGGASPKPAPR